MPGSASGDVHLERRGSAARGLRGGTSPRRDRAGTPSPRCRGASVRTSTPRPCISSLARCATSGGPPGADERAERRRAPSASREQRRRRCTWRAVVVGDRERRAARCGPARRPSAASSAYALAGVDELAAAARDRGRGVAQRRRPRRRASSASVVGRPTSPDRVEQPRQQRAERELVEQHAHLLAVERALAAGRRARRRASTSRTQQRHLAVQEHPVARPRRGSGAASAAARRGARRSLRGRRRW